MALAAGVARERCKSSSLSIAGTKTCDSSRLSDSGGGMNYAAIAGPHSIGVIDETSDVKKGDKTLDAQRQYCGCVGKQEDGIVTVHLGYAQGDFHALVDGELFLPESWLEDPARCRAAGIPDDMVYRSKWKIASEPVDRAASNGMMFEG